MAKATKFEVKKRVDAVYKMLLLGVSRADICQYVLDTWSLSESQADEYIAKANKLFAEKSEPIRNEEFGKALARLQNLYQKNMNIQDYKAALATQKEINALLGLYAPEEKNLTIKDESLSDEQRLERIAELLETARARRDRQASKKQSESSLH